MILGFFFTENTDQVRDRTIYRCLLIQGVISIGIVGWGEGGDELDFIRDIPIPELILIPVYSSMIKNIEFPIILLQCFAVVLLTKL